MNKNLDTLMQQAQETQLKAEMLLQEYSDDDEPKVDKTDYKLKRLYDKEVANRALVTSSVITIMSYMAMNNKRTRLDELKGYCNSSLDNQIKLINDLKGHIDAIKPPEK